MSEISKSPDQLSDAFDYEAYVMSSLWQQRLTDLGFGVDGWTFVYRGSFWRILIETFSGSFLIYTSVWIGDVRVAQACTASWYVGELAEKVLKRMKSNQAVTLSWMQKTVMNLGKSKRDGPS